MRTAHGRIGALAVALCAAVAVHRSAVRWLLACSPECPPPDCVVSLCVWHNRAGRHSTVGHVGAAVLYRTGKSGGNEQRAAVRDTQRTRGCTTQRGAEGRGEEGDAHASTSPSNRLRSLTANRSVVCSFTSLCFASLASPACGRSIALTRQTFVSHRIADEYAPCTATHTSQQPQPPCRTSPSRTRRGRRWSSAETISHSSRRVSWKTKQQTRRNGCGWARPNATVQQWCWSSSLPPLLRWRRLTRILLRSLRIATVCFCLQPCRRMAPSRTRSWR